MADFTLRLIGAGNAFVPDGRLHSNLIIDDSILIDAPPTTLVALRNAGISPAAINHLLITHWHGDHIFGFPFLMLERRFISDPDAEMSLHVHTRRGGSGLLGQLCHLAFPGNVEHMLDGRVTWHDEVEGVVGNDGRWKYIRFEVKHEPLVFPYGYRLEHKTGFTLCHFGDTGPCSAVSEHAATSDLVILEAGVPDGVHGSGHHTPSDVISLAVESPSTQFILTHCFWSAEGDDERVPVFPENVIVAQDGWSFK